MMNITEGDVVIDAGGNEYTVAKIGNEQTPGIEGWDGTTWVQFTNGGWMHAHDLHRKEV